MSAWWAGVPAKIRGVLVVATAVIAFAVVVTMLPFLFAGDSAQATGESLETQRRQQTREAQEREAAEFRAQWEREEAQREAEWLAHEVEAERRAEELAKALSAPQPKRRRIQRFVWQSPADARAEQWNIPEADYAEAEATALLRIFINEADGQELDTHGIWQVLRTIRSSSCDRSHRRRITDCEAVERRGKTVWRESLLSAMKRMSRAVVDDNMTPKNSRQRWTSKVELSCERPEGFPGNEKVWRYQYGVRCPRRAELARKLVSGEEDVDLVKGVRLIAWGGRCRPGQACDNIHACRRGLAMVETDTHNAFWCRPGTTGCSDDVDPICRQYMRLPEGQTHPALVETQRRGG